jgi:hypothetical protein
MELGKWTNNCPICDKKRWYQTKLGFIKGKNKPCVSCSNSLKKGGEGCLYTETTKKCSGCKEVKNLDQYFKYKGDKNKYHSCCIICAKEQSQEYHKETFRFTRYGIDKDKFIKLLNKQNNKCAICYFELDYTKSHIDHDHNTRQVRGILCQLCNKGLGQFKDNINSLKQAIKYLEVWK